MPLTFDICTMRGEYFCHCVIDRNNIIFVFPNTPEGLIQREKTVLPEFSLLPVFHGPFTPVPESARHKSRDHMCAHDKDNPHMHYKLTVDVDFSIIHLVLAALGKKCPDLDITSSIKICKEYFNSLSDNPLTRAIEAEYRTEKETLFSESTKATEDRDTKGHGRKASAAAFFPEPKKSPSSKKSTYLGLKPGFLKTLTT